MSVSVSVCVCVCVCACVCVIFMKCACIIRMCVKKRASTRKCRWHSFKIFIRDATHEKFLALGNFVITTKYLYIPPTLRAISGIVTGNGFFSLSEGRLAPENKISHNYLT